VDMLSKDYTVKEVCLLMGISRSGYYKWKRRPLAPSHLTREKQIKLVEEVHNEHPSHGYRWVAAYIRLTRKVSVSDNFIYKCFRYLGIKARNKASRTLQAS